MRIFQASLLATVMLVGLPAITVADEQAVLQSNTVVFHIEGMT